MKLWLVILVVFATVSCKKILDKQPYTSITDATAYATPERALLVLYGVYDAAQTGFYPGGQRGYPFGAANIEQGDMRGEDMLNIQSFYAITYQGTYNGSSANNVNMWNNLYALINKANIAIAGFKSSTGLPAAVASQYEAECRFLRAMAHHELVINFANPYRDKNGQWEGIPYRETAINSGEAVEQIKSTPKMRVDSVYMKILADLDFAEANLPAGSASTAVTTSIRANKAAAIALKMRVKLHMGDWAGVITEGAKLVPATVTPANPSGTVSPIGGWALTPSPDGPFQITAPSVENIFSIKNDPNDNPGVNASLAGQYGPTSINGASTGARGLVAVSPIIWNNSAWRCDDKRRTLLYTFGTSAASSVQLNVFTLKYRDYTNRSDYAPQIRYAEVLLTLAEAEARNNGSVSQRAIDLLNVVRNRSLASPSTQQYTAANFATKNDLIAAILFERRVEFLAEGKRWGDIHRNVVDPNFSTGGIPAKAFNGVIGASNYTCGTPYSGQIQAAVPYNPTDPASRAFLWPIPDDERSSNPVITQNLGY